MTHICGDPRHSGNDSARSTCSGGAAIGQMRRHHEESAEDSQCYRHQFSAMLLRRSRGEYHGSTGDESRENSTRSMNAVSADGRRCADRQCQTYHGPLDLVAECDTRSGECQQSRRRGTQHTMNRTERTRDRTSMIEDSATPVRDGAALGALIAIANELHNPFY